MIHTDVSYREEVIPRCPRRKILPEILRHLGHVTEAQIVQVRRWNGRKRLKSRRIGDRIRIEECIRHPKGTIDEAEDDIHVGRIVEVFWIHETAEGFRLGLQDRLGVVERDDTSPHGALRECCHIKTSDDSKVVGAALERQPEVGMCARGGIDDLAAGQDHLVAVDVLAAPAVSPGLVAEAACSCVSVPRSDPWVFDYVPPVKNPPTPTPGTRPPKTVRLCGTSCGYMSLQIPPLPMDVTV